jgi:hypothetical protein
MDVLHSFVHKNGNNEVQRQPVIVFQHNLFTDLWMEWRNPFVAACKLYFLMNKYNLNLELSNKV